MEGVHVSYGGDMGRPQGFGQAGPQGGAPNWGAGYGPGQGPIAPMGGGMPAGYPGETYPGMPQGGIPQGVQQGVPQGMPQGMPQGVPQGMPRGASSGGSIRNTLGSGLKQKGIFQKDGQINNSRGGFIGPKQGGGGGMGTGAGPFSFLGQGGGAPSMNQPRQLILESAQAGIAANGIATISPDNLFTCIANLPSPTSLTGQSYGTYAVYLVDEKGSSGFLAGVLRPVGSGVYQTQFRSQVPLLHYNRVLVTIENPQQLGHSPSGPVILHVKQPMGASRFLSPVKKAGGSVWQKISGLFQGRGGVPEIPQTPAGLGEGAIAPEMVQTVNPANPINPEIPTPPPIQ